MDISGSSSLAIRCLGPETEKQGPCDSGVPTTGPAALDLSTASWREGSTSQIVGSGGITVSHGTSKWGRLERGLVD